MLPSLIFLLCLRFVRGGALLDTVLCLRFVRGGVLLGNALIAVVEDACS